jgi:hypothetical protein
VNRIAKIIFNPRERKYKEAQEKCIMRSFIIYTFHQIIFQLQNLKRTDYKEDKGKWIILI